jgi:hypothetical protein
MITVPSNWTVDSRSLRLVLYTGMFSLPSTGMLRPVAGEVETPGAEVSAYLYASVRRLPWDESPVLPEVAGTWAQHTPPCVNAVALRIGTTPNYVMWYFAPGYNPSTPYETSPIQRWGNACPGAAVLIIRPI